MLMRVYDTKIKTLEIVGITGIKNQLALKFNDGMNIICGTNEAGSINILNYIAHFFGYVRNTVDPDSASKNICSEISEYVITYEHNGCAKTARCDVKRFATDKTTRIPSVHSKKGTLFLEDSFIDEHGGVVLIDEADVYLHPKQQLSIIRTIKKAYPNAQVILTTYSPHIVQSAEANEVIPLAVDENGDIAENAFNPGKYGFQGWTIEEILEDVMGMESTRSDLYKRTMKCFNKALDAENSTEAKRNYAILKEMVHPLSHIRKLLEIQMVGIEDEDD